MKKINTITVLGLFLVTIGLGAGACVAGSTDQADENGETASSEPKLSTLDTTSGIWVSQGSGFGPCNALPTTCTVGTTIDAHTGPGLAGGCNLYKCEQAGTWVSQGSDFGPCNVLPTACAVGATIDAHSGPGMAGGCYLYKCEQLGTWVSQGSAFGPCNVLPATCEVGARLTPTRALVWRAAATSTNVNEA